jgi:hypothetical protein
VGIDNKTIAGHFLPFSLPSAGYFHLNNNSSILTENLLVPLRLVRTIKQSEPVRTPLELANKTLRSTNFISMCQLQSYTN